MGLIKRFQRAPTQPTTPSGDLYDLRDWPTITHPDPSTPSNFVWIGSGSALLRRVTNPNDVRMWHRYEGIASASATLPSGLTAGETVHLFLAANSSGDPLQAAGFFSVSPTGDTNRPAGYDWIKFVASFVLNAGALIPPFGTLLYNFSSVKNATTPPGTVIWQAGNTAPSGYLKANGATISRAVYANLFAAIGTIYGAGDGSTTFAIPDLRGEFVRGWDDGRGVDPGRGMGSSQLDQMQRITGAVSFERQDVIVGIGSNYSGAITSPGSTSNNIASGTAARNLGYGIIFNSANSPGARVSPTTEGETRPRNVALLACIKF